MDTPRHFQPHYDAVIVGARCAGAATAILLARAGMKVLVIDRQTYGSDTMSTHAWAALRVCSRGEYSLPGHISRKHRGRLPQGPRSKLAAAQRRRQSRSPSWPL